MDHYNLWLAKIKRKRRTGVADLDNMELQGQSTVHNLWLEVENGKSRQVTIKTTTDGDG